MKGCILNRVHWISWIKYTSKIHGTF